MADDFGYHIDHHGSLVRPPELLAARGSGDPAALAAAEEQAIVAVAHHLRRLVLSAVGDGQFRRSSFESVVYEHVDGFADPCAAAPLGDATGIPAARRRSVASSPVPRRRLAQAEVVPVLATVDRPVFVALPSPGYLAAVGSSLADSAAIDAVRAHGAALAAIVHDEIAALSADGASYVALGNPLYAPLLTVAGRSALTAAGVDVDAVLAAMTEADRLVFSGLSVPDDFRVGLDLTDSGPLPTTSRGYDKAAVETLLDETPFQRLCVDWPSSAQARIPAELVRPGLVLSLGVVDVSTPTAETVEYILPLVDPIADARGESDIAIATNGGFAQIAGRPLMSEEEQDAKLRLVETVARYYWGNEI